MHKINIIIPIYNAEKYLSACLDSVVNQTYQNLEIILVNDGSSDQSPQICDEYASKDTRIKVVHQQNGGLSDARNAGLQIATGEYISFVDNDDLLSLKFYERLIEVALENDADIVECSFKKFLKENEIDDIPETLPTTTEVFAPEEAVELLMKEYLKQTVWNKIYRKDVINGLLFPKDKMNEDEFWTYKVFGNSKRIIKISDHLYFYRQHGESMMGKSYKLHRLDGIKALEERILYMKENFPKLQSLAIKIFCVGAMDHYQIISENPALDPQKIFRRKIIEGVKKYNQASLLKNWDWKAVLWFHLFLKAPALYFRIRNVNEHRIKMRDKKN